MNVVNVFSLFRNYLPFEMGGGLHLKNKNWNPLHPKMHCAKLVQLFLRKRFVNFVNVFSLFRNYLPFERGVTLHLNELESSLPKDALCQVWLKMVGWFLRTRFLDFAIS